MCHFSNKKNSERGWLTLSNGLQITSLSLPLLPCTALCIDCKFKVDRPHLRLNFAQPVICYGYGVRLFYINTQMKDNFKPKFLKRHSTVC